MLDHIKDLLKQGSVKNVYFWQESGLTFKPPAPYLIVKESATVAQYKSYQIFVHFPIGDIKRMNEYINGELVELILSDRNLAGQSKFRITLDGKTTSTDETVVDGFDNTLRGGRSFHLPVVYA